jgi:Mce-associated membrane protein
VEDQQPAAGDLTAESAVDTLEASETLVSNPAGEAEELDSANAATASAAVPASESEVDTAAQADEDAEEAKIDEAAETDATDETADDAETDAARELEDESTGRVVFRTRRPAGKRIAIAVAVAALIFIGSAGFAGAAMQPYLADRAVAATKLSVARAAASAITALWTYTPENMDTLADRASIYLSGDFEAQYRKFVDAIVGPNKQAKITNNTEIAGVGIESLDEPNAVAIVYTNTTSTSPLTKNVPSLKYLSYRLFMKRSNARWLVTRMTTITSLDLTPHV